MDETLGVGLDCGTMNLVSARMGADSVINFRRVRNAFLDLDPEAKKMLKLRKVPYIEDDNVLYVFDDAALKVANFLNRDVRRPLARGLISSGEIQAQKVLSVMISQVLSDPLQEGEPCYYSVPANPVDVPGQDVIYHQEVLRKIINSFGYKAIPWNEAMAIIYSNSEDFSGLAISFGSGMANVALAYETIMGLSFSMTQGGGDWIDANSAKAVGSTPTKICAIKEAGVDLISPANTEQEAIAMYITEMVRSVLFQVSAQFKKNSGTITVPGPIPIILSGGTVRAKNFFTVFERTFKEIKGFPIPISEIRVAKDPMTGVAEGLLTLAVSEDLPLNKETACITVSDPPSRDA